MAAEPAADRAARLRAPLGHGLEHDDFSVVVKNRALMPRPWRWEIYRAGRKTPIECSTVFFETMTEAGRAGKKALGLLLTEFPQ
jgi:hypothetical protein